MTTRTKVFELLIARGLADDERTARGLVMSGKVMVTEPERGERKIDKPNMVVPAASSVRIAGKTRRFVSRAGEKLDAALEAFSIDVTGLVCVDLGLSTGGFTDCLLTRGAARVHGVDLAQGIVDWRIRTDERVRLYERTDATTVDAVTFGEPIDLVTIDLSLVSLTAVLPAARRVADRIVALIKPQYEAPPEALDDGVVVADADRNAAVRRVTDAAESLGLVRTNLIDSPVRKAKGNIELLASFEVAA